MADTQRVADTADRMANNIFAALQAMNRIGEARAQHDANVALFERNRRSQKRLAAIENIEDRLGYVAARILGAVQEMQDRSPETFKLRLVTIEQIKARVDLREQAENHVAAVLALTDESR